MPLQTRRTKRLHLRSSTSRSRRCRRVTTPCVLQLRALDASWPTIAIRVVMQVFQRRHSLLGGMDEAIAILKLCSDDWDALTVHALYDGDEVEAVGDGHDDRGRLHALRPPRDVLSRRPRAEDLIATNVRRVVEAARGKPIIFMPARHDHHRVQTGDGYAAHVAGDDRLPIGVTTDAQASWWGGRGIGTVPHALIAAYGGNTALAATKFAEWAPDDLNVVVLVDFENDSVRTALEVARALGPRLWGVRLDTSRSLVDRSLWDELGEFDPRCQRPARLEGAARARRARVRAGEDRRVGRFRRRRISAFEERRARRLLRRRLGFLRGENDYTGDVVLTDGQPSGKVGRAFKDPNSASGLLRKHAGASGVPPIGAMWTPSSTSWRTSPRSP